ncbi:AAA family ATPase [Luteipulveratus mongoliensis]|uniref:AAA family ATPase n=1 Tax=Luteipulveratus mongoliensis TaxID=571913 RepID=UPI000698B4E0|nr:AAA family ATPase [Luteipulveratus mongoliensis]
MDQPSPYSPGAITPRIAGRNQQRAAIDERLDYLKSFQRLIPQTRVDTGPSGTGKTSLLWHTQQRARRRGVATVWAQCGAAPLLPTIAGQLGQASDGQSTGRIRRVLNSIREHGAFKVKAGVPGVAGAEVEWSREGRPGVERGPASGAIPSIAQTEDLLSTATELARKQGHTGLVLLIDDIDQADAASVRNLFYAWENFQRERPDLPAGIFATGLPHTRAVLSQAAPIADRFAYSDLEPLSPDTVAVALARPAQDVGVLWDHDALRTASDLTRGHPHVLQVIGDETWKTAGYPGPGARITDHHVRAALPAVSRAMQARPDLQIQPPQHDVPAIARPGSLAERVAQAQRSGVPAAQLPRPVQHPTPGQRPDRGLER